MFCLCKCDIVDVHMEILSRQAVSLDLRGEVVGSGQHRGGI